MKLIKLILLTTLMAATLQMFGGWTPQGIHSAAESNLKGVIRTSSRGGNEELNLLLKEGKLVKYATQVIAGINHGAVFKVGSKYACFKIWEKLDRTFEIVSQGSTSNLGDVGILCNIAV